MDLGLPRDSKGRFLPTGAPPRSRSRSRSRGRKRSPKRGSPLRTGPRGGKYRMKGGKKVYQKKGSSRRRSAGRRRSPIRRSPLRRFSAEPWTPGRTYSAGRLGSRRLSQEGLESLRQLALNRPRTPIGQFTPGRGRIGSSARAGGIGSARGSLGLGRVGSARNVATYAGRTGYAGSHYPGGYAGSHY